MNDIEKQVLRLIGENLESPDVFTEDSEDFAQIRDSINNGIDELAIATSCNLTTYLLVGQPNRMLYRMRWPDKGFLYVVEAFDRTNNRKLEQTSIKRLDMMEPRFLRYNGYPTHYFQVGHDTIGLWRRPTTSGQVFEVKCVTTPRHYDAGSLPKVREAHQRAVAYYAVSEYYASRGNAKRAKEAYDEYAMLANLEKHRSKIPEGNLTTQGGNFGYRTNRLS